MAWKVMLGVLACTAAAGCGHGRLNVADEGHATAPVTYRQHIRPIWEARCSACHGEQSPSLAEFEANEAEYAARMVGPRTATYAELLQLVVWPDTGALMRRLDDGRHQPDGQPGNMYENLGDDEAERQRNLALFKAWVGDGAWNLKHWDEIGKDELDRIRALE